MASFITVSSADFGFVFVQDVASIALRPIPFHHSPIRASFSIGIPRSRRFFTAAESLGSCGGGQLGVSRWITTAGDVGGAGSLSSRVSLPRRQSFEKPVPLFVTLN